MTYEPEYVYHKPLEPSGLTYQTHAKCGIYIIGRKIDTNQITHKGQPVTCEDCLADAR